MKSRKDGGPAFPMIWDDHTVHVQNEGMSLRDWFAGKALCGSMHFWEKMMTDEEASRLARWSYRWADAMLKAREEKK